MDKLAQGLAWKSGAMIIVLLVLFIILWANLNSMITEMCQNTVTYQVLSPDKKYKAVIFQRDCGFGSGISTQVSILPFSTPFPEQQGNLFSVDGRSAPGRLHITWNGSKKLVIVYGGRLKILKAKDQVHDVTADYRTSSVDLPVKNK